MDELYIPESNQREMMVTDAVKNFPFLSGVFSGVSVSGEEKTILAESLLRYVNDSSMLNSDSLQKKAQGRSAELTPNDILKAKIALLNEIFTPTYDSSARQDGWRSRLIGGDLEDLGVDRGKASLLLDHEAIVNLISLLAREPYVFRFELGVLLSQVSFDKLSKETKDRLSPVPTTSHLIEGLGQTQGLCPQSEQRLHDSITDRAVLLINDGLLLKYNGKFAALCLRNMLTPEGRMFVAGNWYTINRFNLDSPFPKKACDDAFDIGVSRIKINDDKERWGIMRHLHENSPQKRRAILFWGEFLRNIINYAKRMPDNFGETAGNGMQRKNYRVKFREPRGES